MSSGAGSSEAPTRLDLARLVADAVLYEGYLLYPYRATSRKNQVRWQFGVLGPPGAAAGGVGEESSMSAECLLRNGRESADDPAAVADATVSVHLRFLQLQQRSVERAAPSEPAGYLPVEELMVDGQLLYSWDEAAERTVSWPAFSLRALAAGVVRPVEIAGGEDVAAAGEQDRIVRRRWPLQAELHARTVEVDGLLRLSLSVENTGPPVQTSDEAIRGSLIGAHLLLEARGAAFVSLLDPPPEASAAAAACRQQRCWPVLAGPPGSTDVVLASPIILYDHPEVAAESTGALFDSTEIDEILTLRVMTLTEEEKAEARATDPRAREIIDRCDAMTPEQLQGLHGILRDPYAGARAAAGGPVETPDAEWLESQFGPLGAGSDSPYGSGDLFSTLSDGQSVPWWDPAADESVQPEVDAVLIDGVAVSRGSHVRVHPLRRADAQDLFFEGQIARVTAVLSDVDGGTHVAVVLVDDPASDLHDWYGRYLYFAPDELQPLRDEPEPRPVAQAADQAPPENREEDLT